MSKFRKSPRARSRLSFDIDDEAFAIVPESSQRLQNLFRRFSRDLDNALEIANDRFPKHMSSKGDVCEEKVRKYLNETLGTRYAITDGVIFDLDKGNESRQQDIIIYDDYWSIRFTPRGSNEPAYIPVETVYATIEVKKTLSSDALRDAIENIKSFKSLQREPTGPGHITPNKILEGIGFPGKVDVRNPFVSAIFSFSADRSLDTVLSQLKAEVSGIPPNLWPDIILVHNEGIILPHCLTCHGTADLIHVILQDGHQPSYAYDRFGENSLLYFHLLLMSCLHYTILGPVINFDKAYRDYAHVIRAMGLSRS